MEPQYTLPGVMQFLRSEWQQREQMHIEWELERGELLSRLNRLDAENVDLRRELKEVRRKFDILNVRIRQNMTAKPVVNEESPSQISTAIPPFQETPSSPENVRFETNQDQASFKHLSPTDIESAQSASDDLLETVQDSSSFLKQCISDIKHVLRQSGSLAMDADTLVTFRPGQEVPNFVTLSNFRSSAIAVTPFTEDGIAAGTADGELLVWNKVDIEANEVSPPIVFGKFDESLNDLKYHAGVRKLVAAVSSEIQIYDIQDTPQLVSSVSVLDALNDGRDETGVEPHDPDAAIVQLLVPPTSNLIAAILADGRCSVWALNNNGEIPKLISQPIANVLTGAFTMYQDELHLVLAQGPEETAPNNTEGVLWLVDPISGELLRSVVFLFTNSISAMFVTDEYIILGTDSGDIRVIELPRGETLADMTAAHRSEITSFTTHCDHSGNTLLVSTSVDGRVSVWSLPSLAWKGRMFSHDSAYGALASATGFGRIAISGGDGIIRVYVE